MTGKGVRWGRDRLGRSEPAFLSTTALLPLTCTARGRRHLRLFVCCEAGQLWAVCFEACAGRRVRWLCLPAVPVLQAVCLLPLFTCHAHCPHQFLPPFKFALPPSIHFCFVCPCSMPCAPGSSVRASSLLGPAVCQLRGLSRWQLQHGPAVAARAPVHFDSSFSCRVHDPGPWV